ncbi:MAG: MotA/TolQ/ExbB proton channel family protein [Bryobacteraceae bacterium]
MSLAQHAAGRSAVDAHSQMARRLGGLGTVAATAPFVGMIRTVWGIFNSYPGCGGEKSACMAAVVGPAKLWGRMVFKRQSAFGVPPAESGRSHPACRRFVGGRRRRFDRPDHE